MIERLTQAFALMLVIEGILPFVLPEMWKDTFKKLSTLSGGQIRFFGLLSMLSGLLFLYLFN